VAKNVPHTKTEATNFGPMIGYNYSKIGDFKCGKIYSPDTKNKKYKFMWWIEDKELKSDFFPYNIFDQQCDKMFLVGGEKDALSMLSKGYFAFTLNSETANYTDAIHRLAKRNPDGSERELYVLYDIDSTGVVNSISVSEQFGLKRVVLPESMGGATYGKDVTDLLSFKMRDVDPDSYLRAAISSAVAMPSKDRLETIDTRMQGIMMKSDEIRKRKSGQVEFPPALVKIGDDNMIFPYTINVIQGQTGVHKSRLAEIMASLFLSTPEHDIPELFLGMEKREQPYHVVYVDTERNIRHQLPYTIQYIQERAGIPREVDPDNFSYITLLHEERRNRMKLLSVYLKEQVEKAKGFLVVIMDVITDCVANFNDLTESLEMIDLINKIINDTESTFVCVIHENPGSTEKARGHLGTEIINKSSLQVKVGWEDDKDKRSGKIEVSCVKNRLAPVFASFPCEYDPGLGSLMTPESAGRFNRGDIEDLSARFRRKLQQTKEKIVTTEEPEEVKEEEKKEVLQPSMAFEEKPPPLMDGPSTRFEDVEITSKGKDLDLDQILGEPPEDDMPF
jgi:hypothetical protein